MRYYILTKHNQIFFFTVGKNKMIIRSRFDTKIKKNIFTLNKEIIC